MKDAKPLSGVSLPPPAEPVLDQAARERFRAEWRRNFAVSANAGSGKTTAISERLAAMALDPEGAAELSRTAVVTYTLKAAEEIAERARERLLLRLAERGSEDLAPLHCLGGPYCSVGLLERPLHRAGARPPDS